MRASSEAIGYGAGSTARLASWRRVTDGCNFVHDGRILPSALTDHTTCPEAKFLDKIGTKVFLLAIHSHLINDFPPPPPRAKWYKTDL